MLARRRCRRGSTGVRRRRWPDARQARRTRRASKEGAEPWNAACWKRVMTITLSFAEHDPCPDIQLLETSQEITVQRLLGPARPPLTPFYADLAGGSPAAPPLWPLPPPERRRRPRRFPPFVIQLPARGGGFVSEATRAGSALCAQWHAHDGGATSAAAPRARHSPAVRRCARAGLRAESAGRTGARGASGGRAGRGPGRPG